MKGKRKIRERKGRKKKRKGFVVRCDFHNPSGSRSGTCRTHTRASEGQRTVGSSSAQHLWGGTHGCCFLGPWVHQGGGQVPSLLAPHIFDGLTSFPCTQTGSSRPLWEKQILKPIGRSWKQPLHWVPWRQSDSLKMPQTDCPCQSPLVRYVAQLWLLNQTTICNTARRFCRNADLKWREQSLWTARHRGADISRKCF